MSMMEYKGYHASMDYDTEENVLVGEIFGINDVVFFEGKDLEEFRIMFETSVDDYLKMCEEFGDKPNKDLALAE